MTVLSTVTVLADEEIICIYGKRWYIEVGFKMLKQHLHLEKEAQLRDYEGLFDHVTVVTIRYMFLSFRQRLHRNLRTLGTLCYACCDEVKDLGIVEALQILLSFVIRKIHNTGEFVGNVVSKMIDALMGAAVAVLGNNAHHA